jgi:hypothetical protein
MRLRTGGRCSAAARLATTRIAAILRIRRVEWESQATSPAAPLALRLLGEQVLKHESSHVFDYRSTAAASEVSRAASTSTDTSA